VKVVRDQEIGGNMSASRTRESITRFVTVVAGIFITGQALAEGTGGYESDQGTRIFGTLDPELEGAVIPYGPLHVEAGQLKTDNGVPVQSIVPNNPFALAGAHLAGSATSVSLTVRNARPHFNYFTNIQSPTVWEYEVTVGPGAKPLCFAASNWALAVPGSWNGSQLVTQKDPNTFAFACMPVHDQNVKSPGPRYSTRQLARLVIAQARWHGGAAAKCIDLHYAPWASGVPTLGTPAFGYLPLGATDENARRMHNVCVQAMTADYAGDTQSHTIPGTMIALVNLTNLPSIHRLRMATTNGVPGSISSQPPRTIEFPAPELDDLLFEGVWTDDDNSNGSHRAHVLCLARARWQTLDRSKRPPGPPCDELAIEDLESHVVHDKRQIGRPYLFSYSPMSERGLWRILYGNSWVTTTHVDFTASGPHGPLGPFSDDPGDAHAFFEGVIVSPQALYLKMDQVTPLYLYRKANSFVTTSKATLVPDGYHAMYWSDDVLDTSSSAAHGTPLRTAPGNAMARTAHDHTPVPEGYVFAKAPNVPELNPGLYTKIQVLPLSFRRQQQGPSYCTTAQQDACKDYPSLVDPNQGFLLLPSEAQHPPYQPPLVRGGPQTPSIDPPSGHELGRVKNQPRVPAQP
jgi:ADYC domain-containing protein